MTASDSESQSTQPRSLQSSERLKVGSAELTFLTSTTEAELTAFRHSTRRFLIEKGIDLGEAEILFHTVACRDPVSQSSPALNVLVIRKACSLVGNPRIAMVLEI
jgi:hypothetical protein